MVDHKTSKTVMNDRVKDLPRPSPKPAKHILDLFSLKGKVASVTGSSSGIGLETAKAFAQAGADVAIWYNSHPAEELAEKIAKENGVRCKAYKCNIADAERVEKTMEQIEKDFGTIDIVVANAGVPWTEGRAIEVDGYDGWHKVIDTDLNGVFYAAKTAGRIFEKHGKGSLILTASMSGHIVNFPQLQAPYNAAKAAVLHLGKSLAVEFAPFARVNIVSPGYVATEISDFVPAELKSVWHQQTPLGRECTPQEVASAYLYFASDASSFTTGADLLVDGGYTVP